MERTRQRSGRDDADKTDLNGFFYIIFYRPPAFGFRPPVPNGTFGRGQAEFVYC